MLFLILTILSSSVISILMRTCERHIRNNMLMFAGNYAVCSVLSFLLMDKSSVSISTPGLSFAMILGIISGALYLVSFLMLQLNIRINGVMLAGTFMKLGVLVPTLMAVLLFRELPRPLQIIGFLLAIAAILVINLSPGAQKGAARGKSLLLLLLLSGGLTDSLANIFEQYSAPELKGFYLLVTFAVACMLCIAITAVKHRPARLTDALWGIAIGIPNYFSSHFLLLALHRLPAVLVYPAYNVATILVISLFGILLFHESLGKQKAAGLFLILLSLILLNL